MSKITIYVDGSCLGNGKEINEGGFGVVVVDENENLLYTYKKRNKNTSNNREELRAILYSFLNYGVKVDNMWTGPNNVYIPVVYSDSAYCVNTFTSWIFNWAKNGWIKSDKKVPENLDLIQAYYDWYQKGYRIELRKIKGHANNLGNEIADQLATDKIKTFEEAKNIWDKSIK